MIISSFEDSSKIFFFCWHWKNVLFRILPYLSLNNFILNISYLNSVFLLLILYNRKDVIIWNKCTIIWKCITIESRKYTIQIRNNVGNFISYRNMLYDRFDAFGIYAQIWNIHWVSNKAEINLFSVSWMAQCFNRLNFQHCQSIDFNSLSCTLCNILNIMIWLAFSALLHLLLLKNIARTNTIPAEEFSVCEWRSILL